VSELKESNHSRTHYGDAQQGDPERRWKCAEAFWSYHSCQPREECKTTAHNDRNETERFNITAADDHATIMRLAQLDCRNQAISRFDP
jgi:hypothetical protein